MQPVIYLAFVDDWEVRGNGTGDPRALQFEPMRKPVQIFNNYGIRGSFNLETILRKIDPGVLGQAAVKGTVEF